VAEVAGLDDDNGPDLQSLEQRVEAAAKLIGSLEDERSAYNQSVNNLVELVEQSLRQKQAEADRHEAIVKELVAENERLKQLIGRLLGAVEARPSDGRPGEIADVQGRLAQLIGKESTASAQSAEVVPLSARPEAEVPPAEEADADDGADQADTDEDDTEAAVLAAMNGALAAINETSPRPSSTSEAAQAKSKKAKGGSWFLSGS
jgi:DNA repair exonuclease SbcCD ATPase subunit